MRIDANARTIRQLLQNNKFDPDYYQREYSWQSQHISELIEDLTGNFNDNFKETHKRTEVPNYGHYFLGSIIISNTNGKKYIVDGQQRLMTLTLLLIRLYHLLEPESGRGLVEPLIHSQSGGIEGFNLNFDKWMPILKYLYPGDKLDEKEFDANNYNESIQNIFSRYNDIVNSLEFKEQELLYFVDWLLDNVYLVEISAYDTKDAYAIFETVNDRGLSLTPSDMLRGYLLSKCEDIELRNRASQDWSDTAHVLKQIGKNEESEAIKAWLRCRYSQTNKDFDAIGSEFHRWVEDRKTDLRLNSPSDYANLIERDFRFYSKWYCRLRNAAESFSNAVEDRLEYVFYNAQHNKFTLQYPFLLATLDQNHSEFDNLQKIRIASEYLDILLYRRIWNSDSIAQNTMANMIPPVLPLIRGKNPSELVNILNTWVKEKTEAFTSNRLFRLQSGNRRKVFLILARMTDYVSVQSEDSSHYQDYMRTGKNCYEIEHIWSNEYTPHTDEFDEHEFTQYRDRIGGLLLLPKSENASSGNDPYCKKRKLYSRANLLAQSLHENAYKNNPGFHRFIERSSLQFEAYQVFEKAEFDSRQDLYTQLAEEIWNSERLLKEHGNELEIEADKSIE